ncbi:hypothetical protein ACHWQZ_G010824 [Mnemiopsis leidyi]
MDGKRGEFSNIDSIEKLNKAAECFAETVMEAYNSATELTYISSKNRPPPWDTPEVKDARRDMRNKLRKSIKKRTPGYDKLKRESRQKFILAIYVTPHQDTNIHLAASRMGIFSENRVRRALKEFSPLTAAGPDGIRPIMLQKGWEHLKTAYTSIVKASFRLGHTPSMWLCSAGVFLPKPRKTDYFNPKSFRTITLAPVPLKWMERIILWHMEVDLKIYSNLSKKQFGFRRGSSTIAAVHKLVRKLEFAILNQGMALGTFLDIEGAFDNISFDSIEEALNSKCASRGVNRWIMSMIRNRKIHVELQGETRVILIKKGCPQGGYSLLFYGT